MNALAVWRRSYKGRFYIKVVEKKEGRGERETEKREWSRRCIMKKRGRKKDVVVKNRRLNHVSDTSASLAHTLMSLPLCTHCSVIFCISAVCSLSLQWHDIWDNFGLRNVKTLFRHLSEHLVKSLSWNILSEWIKNQGIFNQWRRII